MGVQGLWNLISPAGRRVKIETLEGKVLAIDVSIWLLKMIHGYLMLGSAEHRNIHLTGIFRRIVKLLYYGIKPVFVFDGKFPELKRETVRRRQEFREKRRFDLKKVAQKFLAKVLEDRLKETVGNMSVPKKSLKKSPEKSKKRKNKNVIEEEEEEKEKENAEPVGDDENEEEDQVFDFEFDMVLDQNKEALQEAGIDLNEFYQQDTETQYKVVKKFKNRMQNRKIKRYLAIDNLDDLSKTHIKDYVKHVKRKNRVEKKRGETYSKKLDAEQEIAMANVKFRDIMGSDYMKSLFLNSNKQVVQGSLASDRRKGFIFLTQRNEAYDTQVLKVEKVRGNRNEKLKKLAQKLKEIARNAEAAPSYFNFDELLCDNPLEAFQYQRMKEEQGHAIPMIKKKEPEQDKENKDINKNVDVDEVFGFNEWEEQNEETQDSVRENIEKLEIQEKDFKAKKEDVDSELEDLFEYHIEESLPSLSQEKTQEDSPGLKESEEKETAEELKKNMSKIIAKYTENKVSNESSDKEEVQIGMKQVDTVEKERELELQKKNVSNIISKYTGAPNIEEKKKEEMQIQVKKIETTSPQKTRERYPNVDTKQFSWFQRLMHDYEAAPAPQVDFQNIQQQQEQPVVAEEMEMEIQMYREKEEPEANIESQRVSQYQEDYQDMSNNMENFWSELDDGEGFDEDKLIKEMKELESSKNMDKWALIQEYQRYQNLAEFESGSITEKFNEIKELLVLFGIPWVESPTEAEAQCSYLEQAGLVDGIITDDSDVFLFGGRHVYRNIFEKGDFAHSYKMSYIENEMCLNREQLIFLALFLGSDYTMGIRGVGIVNAIEIVTAFDNVEALRRFREWAEVPDVLLENASEHYRNVPQKELEYKLYHRNFKKHWELPHDFPDQRVIDGYLHAAVDQSQERFEWGQPDFASLQRFCEQRFKWDEARIYNLLEPLKKVIREKGAQSKITDYFREEKIAEVNSKRISEAIKNLKDKGAEQRERPANITPIIEEKIEKQNPRNIKKRPGGDYESGALQNYAFVKKKTKRG